VSSGVIFPLLDGCTFDAELFKEGIQMSPSSVVAVTERKHRDELVIILRMDRKRSTYCHFRPLQQDVPRIRAGTVVA
jgi:hypothetical protein